MLEEAERLVEQLKRKNLKITFAESCTGGMLASETVSVPGASDVFWGSIVSYDDCVKHSLLGVSDEVLDKFGAVSAQCAVQMARGALKSIEADVAISVTGFAGPGGGTISDPVGTVYIGYADRCSEDYIRIRLAGDRQEVRYKACVEAFKYALSKM